MARSIQCGKNVLKRILFLFLMGVLFPSYAGPLELLREEEIQNQMEVSFLAPIRLIQAVLPNIRERGKGRIINISSPNAFIPPPFGSLYGASKAALVLCFISFWFNFGVKAAIIDDRK